MEKSSPNIANPESYRHSQVKDDNTISSSQNVTKINITLSWALGMSITFVRHRIWSRRESSYIFQEIFCIYSTCFQPSVKTKVCRVVLFILLLRSRRSSFSPGRKRGSEGDGGRVGVPTPKGDPDAGVGQQVRATLRLRSLEYAPAQWMNIFSRLMSTCSWVQIFSRSCVWGKPLVWLKPVLTQRHYTGRLCDIKWMTTFEQNSVFPGPTQ
jgi:hypothetical protein